MRDEITALSFDSAVMMFGIWADNKLAERDENGKPIYKLKELLAPPLTETQRREQTKRSLRLLDIAARKRGSGIQVD